MSISNISYFNSSSVSSNCIQENSLEDQVSLFVANPKSSDAEGTALLISLYEQKRKDLARKLVEDRDEIAGDLLISSCKDGNLDLVKFLVDTREVINFSWRGGTPLSEACEHAHFPVVEFLLEKGASVNLEGPEFDSDFRFAAKYAKNQTFKFPLSAACRSGNLELIKFLLEKGARIQQDPRISMLNPLAMACERGHLDIVQFFLDKGVSVDGFDRGLTPLMEACDHGHLHLVQFLLERGANINLRRECKDSQTFPSSALKIAYQRGFLNIVRLLIDKGADVNVDMNLFGGRFLLLSDRFFLDKCWDVLKACIDTGSKISVDGPLHQAYFAGDAKVVEILGEKPLHAYSKNGLNQLFKDKHFDLLSELLHEGKKSNLKETLIRAASSGRTLTLRFCLEKKDKNFWEGTGCNNWNQWEQSLLKLPASNSQRKIAVMMEKMEPKNIEVENEAGMTLLSIASSLGHVDAVRFLIAEGASIEKKDCNGKTAIMHALERRQWDVLILLQDAGALLDCEKEKIETVILDALKGKQWKVLNYLKNKLRDFSCLEPFLKSEEQFDLWKTLNLRANKIALDPEDSFRKAVKNGNFYLMEFITERQNISYGAPDENGNTPLHLACCSEKANVKVVQFLLEQGVAIDPQNDNKKTALSIACEKGLTKIATLLIHRGANVNLPNHKGETPLLLAITSCPSSFVQFLLQKGASIRSEETDATDSEDEIDSTESASSMKKRTPSVNQALLWQAVNKGKWKTLQILIENGVDPDDPQSFMEHILYHQKMRPTQKWSFLEILLVHALKKQIPFPSFLESTLSAEETPLRIKELILLLQNGGVPAISSSRFDSSEEASLNPLLWAFIRQDLEHIKELLRGEVDLFFQDFYGRTPLMWAVSLGNKDIYDALVNKMERLTPEEKYSLFHYKDHKNQTAFFKAYKKGRLSLLPSLLQNTKEYPPKLLMDAVTMGKWRLSTVLIENGWKGDLTDAAGKHLLFYACEDKQMKIIDILLKQGVDVNMQYSPHFGHNATSSSSQSVEKNGRTPLLESCAWARWDVAQKLIAHGAIIDQQDPESRFTPLLYACHQGKWDIVKQLIERGAAPDQRDPASGLTPLLYAFRQEKWNIVKELIKKGAAPDQQDPVSGLTPLLYACRQQQWDIVKELIKKGAAPDHQDPASGLTPLLYAFRQEKWDIVKELIKKGAAPDQLDPASGLTPLLYAFRQEKWDIVKQLIERGAAPDQRDPESGLTPLLYACRQQQWDIVKQLIEKGAAPDQRDPASGLTPLLFACRERNWKFVKQLITFEVALDQRDPETGRTPLLYACEQDNCDMVKALLGLLPHSEAGKECLLEAKTWAITNKKKKLESILKSDSNASSSSSNAQKQAATTNTANKRRRR